MAGDGEMGLEAMVLTRDYNGKSSYYKQEDQTHRKDGDCYHMSRNDLFLLQ